MSGINIQSLLQTLNLENFDRFGIFQKFFRALLEDNRAPSLRTAGLWPFYLQLQNLRLIVVEPLHVTYFNKEKQQKCQKMRHKKAKSSNNWGTFWLH